MAALSPRRSTSGDHSTLAPRPGTATRAADLGPTAPASQEHRRTPCEDAHREALDHVQQRDEREQPAGCRAPHTGATSIAAWAGSEPARRATVARHASSWPRCLSTTTPCSRAVASRSSRPPAEAWFRSDGWLRRINAGPLIFGGGRALLLDVAHPLVASGVAEHSNFRRPLRPPASARWTPWAPSRTAIAAPRWPRPFGRARARAACRACSPPTPARTGGRHRLPRFCDPDLCALGVGDAGRHGARGLRGFVEELSTRVRGLLRRAVCDRARASVVGAEQLPPTTRPSRRWSTLRRRRHAVRDAL